MRGDSRYAAGFQSIFHRDVQADDVAFVLASYVRSILAGAAPFDRYMNREVAALSDDARRRLQLFRGKANCTACHAGPTFTDERFHNTGVAWVQDRREPGRETRDSAPGALADLGRFVVSGKESDRGAFKTPTLREVARTAPYMHDGTIATLDAVVEFYDGGGRVNPHLDSEIRPLRLTAGERRDLVAFLKSLSGTIREGTQ